MALWFRPVLSALRDTWVSEPMNWEAPKEHLGALPPWIPCTGAKSWLNKEGIMNTVVRGEAGNLGASDLQKVLLGFQQFHFSSSGPRPSRYLLLKQNSRGVSSFQEERLWLPRFPAEEGKGCWLLPESSEASSCLKSKSLKIAVCMSEGTRCFTSMIQVALS